MTPQEQQLVADLFSRLASLEDQRRDADAERLIREGLGRAPNSVYALVQTVLVQDEALKRASARIEELEHAAGAGTAESGGGFLDSVRNLMGGRSDPPRASVPPVRGSGMGSSGVWGSSPDQSAGPAPGPSQPWGSGPGGYPQGGGYAPPPPPPYQGGYPPQGGYPAAPPSGGPSFLGTAAASAAGVVGGAMLLNGIRSMMGPHETFSLGHEHGAAPWDAGTTGAEHGHLAHEAGVDDIGGHRAAAWDDDGRKDDGRNDDSRSDGGGSFLGGSVDDLAGDGDNGSDDDDLGGGGDDFDTA